MSKFKEVIDYECLSKVTSGNGSCDWNFRPEKILPEVNALTTPMPAENRFINCEYIIYSSWEIKIHPISILPDDPDEKQKHIIELVLERFPYLSLRNSDERGDWFSLDSSASCPICNGDHKEKTLGNNIKGGFW
ncbi:unnamed protein product [Rhizophagus irregularis]|nr:unnamed protein product [Rhizophagus irregularis]